MWRLAHNYLPYLSREFWEVLDIHKRDTLGKLEWWPLALLMTSSFDESFSLFSFKLRITRRCQGVGGPLGDVHRDDAKILPTCDGIHLLEEQRRPQGHSQRSQYYVLGDAFRIVVDSDTTMRPISANELFVFSLPSLSSFSVFHDGRGD